MNMEKKIKISLLVLGIVFSVIALVLLWQWKDNIAVSLKGTPPIEAKYWQASSMLRGPRMTEWQTLAYENGEVIVTKVLDGRIVQTKKCQISPNEIKEAVNYFDSPSLKGLSDQGIPSIPGADYEITINTPERSRTIIGSSDFTRIVEFNQYYHRITSWCFLEEK